MRNLIVIVLASALALSGAVLSVGDINGAIRENDLSKLGQLVQSREAANLANGIGVTPLHYAALYGSSEAMEFLLKAKADPNARNQSGATPLVYAAWSFERTRLLVEHGAAVNVLTKGGITPLLVASAAHANVATVRYLLDKGADLHAVSAEGEDALTRAAFAGDPDMLQLLLARGSDAKRSDKAGFTALLNATTYADSERISMLLRAGSDPNALNSFAGVVKNGPIALTHMSALMMAAPSSDQESISILLKAGARINESDSRKMTPLMLSIATDRAQPATVRQLIAAGADVQAKDKYGDSVLDWARRYGNPEILSMLTAAGAEGRAVPHDPVPGAGTTPSAPRDSIGRALILFGKSDFFRAGGGCAGCHHQPAHARAYVAAETAGVSVNPGLRRAFLDSVIANRPRYASVLPYLSSFGGDFDGLLPLLSANAELKQEPNELSDMMVHFLAARQDPSGAWVMNGISRAPLEESTISRTAYAIQALRSYSWAARKAEFDGRVQKAQAWLEQASPVTTYEHADRIFGLNAAGMPAAKLRVDVDRILKLQREDGGWAQTPYLQSDAYATGMVLDILFRTELLKETDPAYRRGVAFLLRTQFPDGSWFVRSRAPKFQPYFQSGLPFDHNQWISSAGTAWAVIALSHAAVPATVAMVEDVRRHSFH